MLRVDIKHDFDDFHLEAKFEAGPGVTALFGPSGAGKSSVIRAISGLLKPDLGSIFFGETRLLERGKSLAVHRRRMGLVFQDARLFPHLSVDQNLSYGARFARGAKSFAKRNEVIELLDLGHLLDRHTTRLSGGEAQRVAIARALLSAPRMLLLDEPLASLDAPRKGEILPYLERLKSEADLPIIYVSHSIDEIARLADRLVLLRDGRVVRQGPIFEVLSDPEMIPLIGVRDAGAIIAAQVESHAEDGLSTLRVAAGTLELPGVSAKPGTTLRLRIMARDVLIATRKPVGLSAINRLPVTITEIFDGQGPGAALVLDAGGDRILARITARTVARLKLKPGLRCYAILKAMSVAPVAIGQSTDLPPPPKVAARPSRNLDPSFLGNSLRHPEPRMPRGHGEKDDG